MKTVGLIGHYIRNEEIVGLTEEFCRKEESIADVKQFESFIANMAT